MIVSFASSKGGVGKSTTCAAIGSRLAQRGEQVLIIDLDQNKTLERWGRKAKVPGLTVSAVERDQFNPTSPTGGVRRAEAPGIIGAKVQRSALQGWSTQAAWWLAAVIFGGG